MANNFADKIDHIDNTLCAWQVWSQISDDVHIDRVNVGNIEEVDTE